MGVIVTFDYDQWKVLYPQLALTVNAAQANAFFVKAQLFLRNDGQGPVNSPVVAQQLFNLLVAHQAALSINAARTGGVVGRLASASEQGVSATFDYPSSPSAAWYNQTPYGAEYWMATRPYRTMNYRPGPQRNFQPGVPR